MIELPMPDGGADVIRFEDWTKNRKKPAGGAAGAENLTKTVAQAMDTAVAGTMVPKETTGSNGAERVSVTVGADLACAEALGEGATTGNPLRLPSWRTAMTLGRFFAGDISAIWVTYPTSAGEAEPMAISDLPLAPGAVADSGQEWGWDEEDPIELPLEAAIAVRELFDPEEGPYVRLPEGLDLTGRDLSNKNLCRMDFNGARMDGVRLTATSLRDSRLSGSSLRSANMERADLGDAEICWCDLRGADLSNACLQKANLSGSDLTAATLGADLRGAQMRGVRIGNAYLVDAELTGADLDGVRANKNTVMTGANIWETRTTDFRINGKPGTPEQLGAVRRDPLIAAIARKLGIESMNS